MYDKAIYNPEKAAKEFEEMAALIPKIGDEIVIETEPTGCRGRFFVYNIEHIDLFGLYMTKGELIDKFNSQYKDDDKICLLDRSIFIDRLEEFTIGVYDKEITAGPYIYTIPCDRMLAGDNDQPALCVLFKTFMNGVTHLYSEILLDQFDWFYEGELNIASDGTMTMRRDR